MGDSELEATICQHLVREHGSLAGAFAHLDPGECGRLSKAQFETGLDSLPRLELSKTELKILTLRVTEGADWVTWSRFHAVFDKAIKAEKDIELLRMRLEAALVAKFGFPANAFRRIADPDGSVRFNTFKKLFVDLDVPGSVPEIRNLFSRLDCRGTGLLTPIQWTKIFQAAPKEQANVEIVGEALRKQYATLNDAFQALCDDQGTISQAQFVDLGTQFPQLNLSRGAWRELFQEAASLDDGFSTTQAEVLDAARFCWMFEEPVARVQMVINSVAGKINEAFRSPVVAWELMDDQSCNSFSVPILMKRLRLLWGNQTDGLPPRILIQRWLETIAEKDVVTRRAFTQCLENAEPSNQPQAWIPFAKVAMTGPTSRQRFLAASLTGQKPAFGLFGGMDCLDITSPGTVRRLQSFDFKETPRPKPAPTKAKTTCPPQTFTSSSLVGKGLLLLRATAAVLEDKYQGDMLAAFGQFDVDGDGKLSVSELRAGMESCGLVLTEAQVLQLLNMSGLHFKWINVDQFCDAFQYQPCARKPKPQPEPDTAPAPANKPSTPATPSPSRQARSEAPSSHAATSTAQETGAARLASPPPDESSTPSVATPTQDTLSPPLAASPPALAPSPPSSGGATSNRGTLSRPSLTPPAPLQTPAPPPTDSPAHSPPLFRLRSRPQFVIVSSEASDGSSQDSPPTISSVLPPRTSTNTAPPKTTPRPPGAGVAPKPPTPRPPLHDRAASPKITAIELTPTPPRVARTGSLSSSPSKHQDNRYLGMSSSTPVTPDRTPASSRPGSPTHDIAKPLALVATPGLVASALARPLGRSKAAHHRKSAAAGSGKALVSSAPCSLATSPEAAPEDTKAVSSRPVHFSRRSPSERMNPRSFSLTTATNPPSASPTVTETSNSTPATRGRPASARTRRLSSASLFSLSGPASPVTPASSEDSARSSGPHSISPRPRRAKVPTQAKGARRSSASPRRHSVGGTVAPLLSKLADRLAPADKVELFSPTAEAFSSWSLSRLASSSTLPPSDASPSVRDGADEQSEPVSACRPVVAQITVALPPLTPGEQQS
eukprot:CAMPEP_0114549618 /NCGR_PEP_ID=MMETSP0114-20121206/5623_1 /TAXON_ID=31324 /ORGANISM="Goniomonas sp, Strain m" /LENGTH=1059 /DNA_ID=CAMNT_0001734311 /DNA_START=398 /DNA_END=3574 /DNA_ORIENTATION=-